MKTFKVLHIANWYPNIFESKEALFVKEHFIALQKFCTNELVHIKVNYSKETFFKLVTYSISDHEKAYIVQTKIDKWGIIELFYLGLVLWVCFKYKINKSFQIVNFHIAYPLLTYIKLLQKIINIPMVLTEHWTAYHYHFNLPKSTKKLDKIKNIFHCPIPIFTVSEALANDIRSFSGNFNIYNEVVPNIVDQHIFAYKVKKKGKITFFMVNYWRTIKKPFVIFNAFKEMLRTFPDAHLTVGGYGPLWDEMVHFVKENNLTKNVTFLGRLSKEEVAAEMQKCLIFLHAADYETFSVVCAEALMCGTPVIVTKLPAVSEFINSKNGFLIEDEKEWPKALVNAVQNYETFSNEEIAKAASERFSTLHVGEKYYKSLQFVLNV